MEERKKIGLVATIRNTINAAVGYQQTFEQLVNNGDVTRAIAMMRDHSREAIMCLRECKTDTHKIMEKPKKAVYDKNGDFIREKDVNRIVIPYHDFINEVALVFLYGRPPVWENNTPHKYKKERRKATEQLEGIEQMDDATKFALQAKIAQIDEYDKGVDEKFSEFTTYMSKLHLHSNLRKAKRAAGREKSSALLFHTYQEDGEPKCRIKVLSKDTGDDIYTLFDQYGKMVSCAWGYYTLDSKSRSIEHYDIYFPEVIYRCERTNMGGWTVKKTTNPVGKIPMIVFMQEKEWEGVQEMIDRVENARSKIADTNDDFSTPALVATAKIMNTLPKQEEDSRLYVLDNGGEIKYLERNGNNEARSSEIEDLDSQIMHKSFTPDLSVESLSGLNDASGATVDKIMVLANIKADKHKENHDDYLDRIASLGCAIMDNVTHIESKGYSELVIGHKFSRPYGDDIKQTFEDLIKSYNSGGMSRQTFVEKNYLVEDAGRELELLKKEEEAAAERQNNSMMLDVFAGAQ